MPDIKCPSCGHEFPLEEAVSEDYKKELREQMVTYKKQKDDEMHRKEQEWQQQLQKTELGFAEQLRHEKTRLQQSLEESIRKTITSDFENKLRMLEQNNKDNDEKLKLARQKELEFLRLQQEFKTKTEEIDLTIQKKLQAEREKMSEEVRKLEEQKTFARESEFQLKLKELEKQLDDQRKLAEEMRRKAEQGSMQLQGEVQELALEELLRTAFPFDEVQEVGKGVEGADCILVVRNASGIECGKIIFESKRTKGWNNNWVDKLKNDMRSRQADLAILVSQTFPKGMECFGEKDGVWIANFKEVTGLTIALRNAIIRIAETKKAEENKGEKMQMLYNYLTGTEFRQQIEAIVEGFMAMKHSISKERIQMEKLWKEREKQLEKVLLNTSGMYGSVKGIAGSSVRNIPLLEGGDEGEATNGLDDR
jgi:hypothetical protein